MNWKKILFYTISFLTGFVVIFCAGLEMNGVSVVEKLNNYFLLLIICVGLCLLWALLLLITSVALLFKESWREEAFLMFAGTNAEDELEQAAVNDAIKKTFLLNLLIIVSAVILSGFTYTKLLESEDGKNHALSYRLMNSYESIDKVIDTLESLNLEGPLVEESIESFKAMRSGETYYLIPKTVFSPYGALCFILIQFITFRSFLFFNRRRFL